MSINVGWFRLMLPLFIWRERMRLISPTSFNDTLMEYFFLSKFYSFSASVSWRYLLCQSSSSSRRRGGDKSVHREMTITSQSTIYRRYTSKKYTNQSIRRWEKRVFIDRLFVGSSIARMDKIFITFLSSSSFIIIAWKSLRFLTFKEKFSFLPAIESSYFPF